MRKWQCATCGPVYGGTKGWSEEGIEAGTYWKDMSEDWLRSDCDVGKLDFEMIETG